MIITLCGSSRLREYFDDVNRNLTLQGHIVISLGVWKEELTGKQKRELDELHKRKIDLSDAIYVINKDKYIGATTKHEIDYARGKGKTILWLEDEQVYTCKQGKLERV